MMDGYKLDVFAMEPVTMRWVNTELTLAMDLFDHSVKGLRLRPVAAKSADVASVLLQCLTPTTVGPEARPPVRAVRRRPRGTWFWGRLGCSQTPSSSTKARCTCPSTRWECAAGWGSPCSRQSRTKPTDKPALERFFKSLRLSLLDKLSGYKGPNIASRGNDVEKGAFYYVTELEDLNREWVGDVYHLRAHRGLRDPLLPKVDLSPQEMFNRGIEFSGLLRLPAAEDLRYELMEVQWHKIHHYGVDIDGRRYDGPGLNTYRARRSDYGGYPCPRC